MGSKLSAFGITGPIALAAVGGAAIKFGIDAVKAFEESQQVMAQTEAVIKSTGGTANVTAKQVSEFASTWQGLTGIQDEAIQSSENILLTFRDVRNEVGKGNDIFNQAQVSILNMATALNRGATPSAEQLQSATLQLGKALNDPIAGLTALKRAGVSFSESQIETIRKLQESGDLMGAQKLILAELSKEFGGAAKAAGETFAGQMAILGAEIDDVKEKIGAGLVPQLEDLIGLASDLTQGDALPAVSHELSLFGKITSVLPGPVQGLGEAIQNLRGGMDSSTEATKESTKALNALPPPTDTAANSMDRLAAAEDSATDKARDQRLAILGLTNSFLGILDSAKQVAEAQRTLTQLQEHGKQGTEKYKDAVLEAITAQAGLEGAVLAYSKELAASGDTQKQVIGKIQDLGKQLGLQKSDLAGLISKVREYIGALDAVPSTVTTRFVQTGGGVTFHPLPVTQHGGVVTSAQARIVGEAGPEAIIPLSKLGTLGGAGGDIVLQISGQTFARITRDEINKLQARNATSGLK